MEASRDANFKHQYAVHLKQLDLQRHRSKTIGAYARAVRYIETCFDVAIDDLRKPLSAAKLGKRPVISASCERNGITSLVRGGVRVWWADAHDVGLLRSRPYLSPCQ